MSGLVKLWRQKHNPPANPTTSFTRKTILITGANTGLGYEAALKFHQLGAARLVFGVRNVSSGEEAAQKIRSTSKGNGTIDVLPVDMLSYASIKAFTERIRTDVPQLDVAVLNAGIMASSPTISTYGHALTIQVNTLSTMLLALLLLPQLRVSHQPGEDAPVLQFVSSSVISHLTWDEELRGTTRPLALIDKRVQEGKSLYRPDVYYGASKVLLQACCRTLAGLPDSKDVIVTSVCPGFTSTNLARDLKQWYLVAGMRVFYSVFGRSAEEGARSYVSGVALGEKGRGGFWLDDRLQPTADLLAGKDGGTRAENIWHEVIGALGKDVSEVLELVKLD